MAAYGRPFSQRKSYKEAKTILSIDSLELILSIENS
jgi:hypothetical protein